MEKTFQNPEWYSETRADYPLTISAMEALRSGKLDAEYNDIGRDYEARQGISKRSKCPIYLAVKTHVLAIEAAIKEGIEKDFYVSDLFDIFRAIQERSKFNKIVWEDPRANREFPTPYAFLLYTIAADLENLSCEAVERANRRSGPHHIEAPGGVAHALAQNWSFCVWSIAESLHQVAPEFRNDIIREYLAFMLKLGWEPSEICFGCGGSDAESLGAWRDMFLGKLLERFMHGGSTRMGALENAAESLDKGKGYYDGYAWLEKQLLSRD